MSSPPVEASLPVVQSVAPVVSTTAVTETNASDVKKMFADSSDTIITMLAVGFFGFLIGTAQRAWESRRRMKGRHRSKKSGIGKAAGSFSDGFSDESFNYTNSASSVHSSIKERTMSPTNSVGSLRASAPRNEMKTDVHCQRCAKILDWEEANKPFRRRLKSPSSSELDLMKSVGKNEKGCSKSLDIKKPRRRVSFGPPPRHYRRIVCFGDSNTWGFDPASQDRLEMRWPLVMGANLGNSYKVVEEGLNGRTIDKEDPVRSKEKGFSHSGLEHVASVLSTHKPLDLVVIFLGINDLKTRLNPSKESLVRGMQKLITRIKKLEVFPKLTKEQTAFDKTRIQILLMAPPLVTNENPTIGFGQKAIEVSSVLTLAFENLAKEEKIHFLATSDFIQTSELDSIHFGPEMHRKLGEVAAKKVRELFLKSEEGED